MTSEPVKSSPELWLTQLFEARAAVEGGVVRRKLADIDQLVGRARFQAEVRRRGFSAVENAGFVVVFCNGAPIVPLR